MIIDCYEAYLDIRGISVFLATFEWLEIALHQIDTVVYQLLCFDR
jgi:hypothetical protein